MSTELLTLDQQTAAALFSKVETKGDVTKIDTIGGEKPLDPKGSTLIGHAQGNTHASISISGKWCPGHRHPFWPPTGDSNTKFNGANKWSAIVYVYAADFSLQRAGLIQAFQYPGRDTKLPTASPFGVLVYVIMNDDDFRDNSQHPKSPMRAYFSGGVSE